MESTAATPAACPSSIVVGATRADPAASYEAEIALLATRRLSTRDGTKARSGIV